MKNILVFLITFCCPLLLSAIDLETYFLAALAEKDKPEIAAYLINLFPPEKKASMINRYNQSFSAAPYDPSRYLSEEVQKELKNLRDENAQLKEQITRQQTHINTLRKEQADKSAQTEQLTKELQEVRSERDVLRKQVADAAQETAQIAGLRTQLQAFTQEKTKLENENKTLQLQLEQVQKDAQQKITEAQSITTQKNEVQEQLVVVTQKKDTLEKEKNALEAQRAQEQKKYAEEQAIQKQEKEKLTARIEALERASSWAQQLAQQKDKKPWELAERFFKQEGQPGTAFINTLASFKQEDGARAVAQSIIDQLQHKVLKPSPIQSTEQEGKKESQKTEELD